MRFQSSNFKKGFLPRPEVFAAFVCKCVILVMGIRMICYNVALDYHPLDRLGILLRVFPYEEESVLIDCLDLFRRVQPDVVNINTYIRLYKALKVTEIVTKDRTLYPYLLGATEDRSMIKPVFYNHVSAKRLRELIQGEPLFKIAGEEKGVNYSNVK